MCSLPSGKFSSSMEEISIHTLKTNYQSVSHFSRSGVSDSLQLHESQYSRPPSIINSRSLLKLMSIESVMLSSHLILCRPLLLLPTIFPRIRVYSNESALRIRWPKYGASASASVLLMNIQD